MYSGILPGGLCLPVRARVDGNCPVNQRSSDPPASRHSFTAWWWLRHHVCFLTAHLSPLAISPSRLFIRFCAPCLVSVGLKRNFSAIRASISLSVHHRRAGRLGPGKCVWAGWERCQVADCSGCLGPAAHLYSVPGQTGDVLFPRLPCPRATLSN